MKTETRHYRSTPAFRCFPNPEQEKILEEFLETSRQFWNYTLDKIENIPSYLELWPENEKNLDPMEIEFSPITYYDLCAELTEERKINPEIGKMPRTVSENILENIINAQKAEKALQKKGHKAGSLSYKKFGEINSLKVLKFVHKGQKLRLRNVSGKYGYLTVTGIPKAIKIKMHCKIPENAKQIDATLKKNYKGQWHLRINLRFETPEKMKVKKCLGADVGLRDLATLSDGIKYKILKFYQETEMKRALLKRRIARKYVEGQKKQSNNYKRALMILRNFEAKLARKRAYYIDHEIVNPIIKKCLALGIGLALENLNLKGMLKKEGHLGKSFHNATLGILIQRLQDKCEALGIPVMLVNPRNTSQMCSSCNEIVPKGRGVTIHSCPHCGLILDRDHNAAINIAYRAEYGPPGHVQEINNLLNKSRQTPEIFARSNNAGSLVIPQGVV